MNIKTTMQHLIHLWLLVILCLLLVACGKSANETPIDISSIQTAAVQTAIVEANSNQKATENLPTNTLEPAKLFNVYTTKVLYGQDAVNVIEKFGGSSPRDDEKLWAAEIILQNVYGSGLFIDKDFNRDTTVYDNEGYERYVIINFSPESNVAVASPIIYLPADGIITLIAYGVVPHKFTPSQVQIRVGTKGAYEMVTADLTQIQKSPSFGTTLTSLPSPKGFVLEIPNDLRAVIKDTNCERSLYHTYFVLEVESENTGGYNLSITNLYGQGITNHGHHFYHVIIPGEAENKLKPLSPGSKVTVNYKIGGMNSSTEFDFAYLLLTIQGNTDTAYGEFIIKCK